MKVLEVCITIASMYVCMCVYVMYVRNVHTYVCVCVSMHDQAKRYFIFSSERRLPPRPKKWTER